jgi:WD40 repeat protein
MWPRSVFGYDFFISYRREKWTAAYALRLYEELRKRNYRCFVDRQEFEAGPELERRLIRAVGLSSILLLVLTSGAAESKYVQLEVRTALKNRRRIVPINIGESYDRQQWPDLISHDLAWIDESQENLASGKTDGEVIDNVERAYRKPRLNVIRVRLLAATVALLSVLVALAGFFWFQERKQANVALARQLAAQAQLVTTEQPSWLERAALLAIESMRRHPSLEGDIALRDSARLLPILLRERNSTEFFRNVAVSPDQNIIAASAGGQLILLDGRIGTELSHFSHKGEIRTVRFSPDGRWLVTASEDATAETIDIGRRTQTHVLRHGADVRTAVVSPDGLRIATVSEDKTGALWSAEDGHRIAKLTHASLVEDVVFSPDGRFVATGSQDQTARIWGLDLRRPIASVRFERPKTNLTIWMKGTTRTQTVLFSPDGHWFAAGGIDGSVALFETRTWKEVYRLHHDSAVSNLAFTPDSRELLTVPSQAVIVWDVGNGRQLARLKHGGLVYDMKFSPDGSLLATASQDQTARVWDTSAWNELFRVCAGDAIGSVAFGAGDTLITAGDSLRLWDLSASREKLLSHKSRVLGLAFSPDGGLLATASVGARVWNTRDWRSQDISPGTNVRAVGFSADGQQLALGSNGGEIAIFHSGSWRRLWARMLHTDRVNSVAFSPDGRFVVSGSLDNAAIVWDTIADREAWRYEAEGEINSARFSPVGEWLAVAAQADGDVGKVVIVSWKARRPIGTINTSSTPESLAWSPDGRILAIGLADGNIHIVMAGRWDKETATLGNLDVIRDLAFSKSGNRLVSGGRDGSARIWETDQWTEISRLRLPSVVIGVGFTPDESQIAASFDQMVQIDFVHADDLIREACVHLTRPLSAEEWHLYLPSESYRRTCPIAKQ